MGHSRLFRTRRSLGQARKAMGDPQPARPRRGAFTNRVSTPQRVPAGPYQCNRYRLVSMAPKSHPATTTAKTMKTTSMVRIFGEKRLLFLRSVRSQGMVSLHHTPSTRAGFHEAVT